MAESPKEERSQDEEELAALLLLVWATFSAGTWTTSTFTARDFRALLANNGAERLIDRIVAAARTRFETETGVVPQQASSVQQTAIRERYLDRLAGRLAEKQANLPPIVNKTALPDSPVVPGLPIADHESTTEAVTSVTEIVSLAELEMANRALQPVEAFWITEPVACPICYPLHGTSRSTWSIKFADGPPAHPNCRCHLEWLIVSMP